MRRPLVAGNWKMYKTAEPAEELARSIVAQVGRDCEVVDVVLCPPFTSLQAVHEALAGTPIALGAQNMHWENEGAFTGEISPAMILTTGCTYVILGHSERRQYFAETDEQVNRKLKAALGAGLSPIVCVGETLQQREAGQIEAVVLGQVQAALQGLSESELLKIALAYEPVWAIGTGRTATPAQAEEVHSLIRTSLHQQYGEGVAGALRIQYGGSVKPENAAELFTQKNIDGGLIGGAALKADSFAAIVKAAC
ncbi:MAG: triose-phosphate isomerase [Candidatus Latescibacteria bacterium]|nr:triose-phosphate isomerase [Candidatus Latescibacterota bacterium]